MQKSRVKTIGRAAALVLITALAAVACTSSHSPGASSAPNSPSVAKAQDSSYTIDWIGGPSSDPFWAAIEKGAQQAGSDLGVHVSYVTTSNPSAGAADYAQLVSTAISQKPSGLVTGDFFPSAMEPVIKQAVASGIPLVMANQGKSTWQGLGALSYFGQDETLAGNLAAQEMIKEGVRNALCINHVPGAPVGEERCGGFNATMTQAGYKAKTITTPLSDNTNVSALTQDIAAALHSNPGVQGIFTLGVLVAQAAGSAVSSAGQSQVKIGTADLSTAVLNDIKSNKLAFAIDQQPYLQGYDSVLAMVQYLRYGLHPVGEVRTGPLLITSANVQQFLSVNQQYPGVRGAA
jgi:simple sugar transport system substrate-binding protein